MTRLESGALQPRTSLNELSDVIGAVLRRASKILAAHRIEVDLAPGLPLVALDMVLFEQVLFNLLDNAAKYAPAGSLITIAAQREADSVILRIMDEGEGIPPGMSSGYSRSSTARAVAIAGVPALDWALRFAADSWKPWTGRSRPNRPDRQGAIFVITLPVPVNALLPEEETIEAAHDYRGRPATGSGGGRRACDPAVPAGGLASQGYVVSEARGRSCRRSISRGAKAPI